MGLLNEPHLTKELSNDRVIKRCQHLHTHSLASCMHSSGFLDTLSVTPRCHRHVSKQIYRHRPEIEVVFISQLLTFGYEPSYLYPLVARQVGDTEVPYRPYSCVGLLQAFRSFNRLLLSVAPISLAKAPSCERGIG